MKKKLIIHIGTPKTGSSFLQEVCIENYDKLLESGVLYPGVEDGKFVKEANFPINASHILRLFFDELDKESICNLVKEQLIQVFSFNVSTVLISDETFTAFNVLNKGNLYIFECLIETCNSLDIDLSFIAYYRQPSKYLPSHWAQLVKKHKETLSLVKFIEQNKIPYWKNVISLHELYNKTSVFSYDKEASVDGGLARSFFNAIDVNPEGFNLLVSESVNPSLSLNCLTALRLINAEFDDVAIKDIEKILTNAQPKYKLCKAALTKELELSTDKLYSEELDSLISISKSSD